MRDVTVHADGRNARLIKQLSIVDLLILDDWGLEKLNLGQRNYLLEIMEDPHALKSMLITAQLPIDQWHKAIGNVTLADAILDRLVQDKAERRFRAQTHE